MVGKKTGIGRYVYGLLKSYASILTDFDISVFYFNERNRFKDYSIFKNNKHLLNKEIKYFPGAYSFYIWPFFPFPKVEHFIGNHDIYHCTNYLDIPRKSGLSLITIYDLAFKRFPECAERYNKLRINNNILKSIQNVSGIITISEFTKNEIINLFNYPKEKIFAIHLGVDPEITQTTITQDIKDILGFSGPYLLHVGTIEPRKNLSFLVQAFNIIAKTDKEVHLVLIGNKGWKSENILRAIETSPVKDRIHIVGYLPDNSMGVIYRNAQVFVFPSLYEGFGFPPLEAMQCGVPVISSNAASLVEVLRDGALLFDPNTTTAQQLSELIIELIHNERLRQHLIAKGYEVSKIYAWEKTALRTLELYKKIGSG